jgi:hypothetical protein
MWCLFTHSASGSLIDQFFTGNINRLIDWAVNYLTLPVFISFSSAVCIMGETPGKDTAVCLVACSLSLLHYSEESCIRGFIFIHDDAASGFGVGLH